MEESVKNAKGLNIFEKYLTLWDDTKLLENKYLATNWKYSAPILGTVISRQGIDPPSFTCYDCSSPQEGANTGSLRERQGKNAEEAKN